MKTNILTDIFYIAASIMFFVLGCVEIFQATMMIKPYNYKYGGAGIAFLLLGVIYLLFRFNFLKPNFFVNISAYIIVFTLLAGVFHIWGFGMFAGAAENILLGSFFIVILLIGLIIAVIKKFKN